MSIWKWLGKLFKSIKDDADKVAMSITEGIKTSLKSGILPSVAAVVDKALHTQLGAEIIALLYANINKILATELAIKGLPDNPTELDIIAFEKDVVAAIGVSQDNSKLWTTLSAQVYGIIETQVNNKTPLTFATLVTVVEEAWQDYQTDIAA